MATWLPLKVKRHHEILAPHLCPRLFHKSSPDPTNFRCQAQPWWHLQSISNGYFSTISSAHIIVLQLALSLPSLTFCFRVTGRKLPMIDWASLGRRHSVPCFKARREALPPHRHTRHKNFCWIQCILDFYSLQGCEGLKTFSFFDTVHSGWWICSCNHSTFPVLVS